MSEEGRLGLSGPEVIETVKGVGEFDSRDRSLVWRVTGGKLRRALGEATALVDDDVASFRAGVEACLARPAPGRDAIDDLDVLLAAQDKLQRRRATLADARDGLDVWRSTGFPDPQAVPMLTAESFNQQLAVVQAEVRS